MKMQVRLLLSATVASVFLAACGGGGGGGSSGAGTSAGSGADAGGTPVVSCTPTMANPTACNGSISLLLANSRGQATTQIWPDSPGTLVAAVRAWNSAPLVDVPVVFETSDGTVADTTNRTVKTDADGLARLVLPAGTSAGNFTVKASAVAGLSSLQATTAYSVVFPTLSLTMLDRANTTTKQVAPDNAATVVATIKQPDGSPVPNVVVRFESNDPSAVFKPASGSAMTDDSGVARVGLPAGIQAGAYTVSAVAAVTNKTLSSSYTYAASFPELSLSALSIRPTTISTRGTGSIDVTVFDGSKPYTVPLQVVFTSECVKANKARVDSPVLTRDGVATTTYTDLGCGKNSDLLEASVTLAANTSTRSGQINVTPASAGYITFVNADTTNLALAHTGGFGRSEISTLTFKVFDSKGLVVPNARVDFVFADTGTATAVGNMSLNTSSALSDADGIVTTQVQAGTTPTSVRVMAMVRDTKVTTLSNILVVSTGAPDNAHFSLGSSVGVCEGQDINQECSTLTVRLADHFGNPVPDGTAVNFSAEGGSIDASCVTGSLPSSGATPVGQTTNSKVGPGSGACSVKFYAQSPRSANGRVTILAYVLGEENFNDSNGNNVCDNCYDFNGPEFKAKFDLNRDIFRDDDESGAWTKGEICIGPNLSKECSTPGDGMYNGVLRTPLPNGTPQTVYLARQLVMVLGGSTAVITPTKSSLTCSANGSASLQFTVKDRNNHPMPDGTKVELSASFAVSGGSVLPTSYTVRNDVIGVGEALAVPTYAADVACATTPLSQDGKTGGNAVSGALQIKVTAPSGALSVVSVPIHPASQP